MKIQFYGDSCFQIEGKDNAVVFNPTETFRESVDVALLTSEKDTEVSPVENAKKTLSLPGEFEISGILLRGFYADDRVNVIYKVTFDDIACVHLGKIQDKPSKELIKKLGENVEVLFVTLSDKMTVKEARQIIEEIDPRVTFIGGDQSQFPKMIEQGAHLDEDNTRTLSKSSFNEEKTEIVILSV